MDNEKRKRLEAAGWKSGTVAEFLGLYEKDAVVVEMRMALSKALNEFGILIGDQSRFWGIKRNLPHTPAILNLRLRF